MVEVWERIAKRRGTILLDRNMLFGPEEKCLHCHEKRKTVDQLATQCDCILLYAKTRRDASI